MKRTTNRIGLNLDKLQQNQINQFGKYFDSENDKTRPHTLYQLIRIDTVRQTVLNIFVRVFCKQHVMAYE